MANSVEKMFQQLDETAKGRIVTLNGMRMHAAEGGNSHTWCLYLAEFRHYLRSQALEITKESHELEKTIASGNISSLIDSNGDLKTEVSAVIRKLLTPSHQIESLPTLSDFIKLVIQIFLCWQTWSPFSLTYSEVIPQYDSAFFKISSFCEKQRKGEEVYSKPLQVQGLVWRLKVYPVSVLATS